MSFARKVKRHQGPRTTHLGADREKVLKDAEFCLQGAEEWTARVTTIFDMIVRGDTDRVSECTEAEQEDYFREIADAIELFTGYPCDNNPCYRFQDEGENTVYWGCLMVCHVPGRDILIPFNTDTRFGVSPEVNTL